MAADNVSDAMNRLPDDFAERLTASLRKVRIVTDVQRPSRKRCPHCGR